MQTEKAKSSHFDRTRGLKNQIFPTLDTQTTLELFFEKEYSVECIQIPNFHWEGCQCPSLLHFYSLSELFLVYYQY